MQNLTQILSQPKIRLLIWVFIFITPLAFIWQGGDLTDTGYNVSLYHFFFDRLDQGITDPLIFLTGLIGGSWYQCFPSLGVMGFKILAVLVLYANIFLSYRILQSLFPNHPLIPFFLWGGVIFSIRAFPIIFNYDLFTSFLLLLSIYLLKDKEKSLTYQQLFYLGIISGLLILARFPNIFFIPLLSLSLFIAKFFNIIKISYLKIWKLLSIYYVSCLVFLLLFFNILGLFGWDAIFFQHFIDFRKMLSSQSESYQLSYVINKYLMDGFYFGIYFVATGLIFLTSMYLQKKRTHKLPPLLFLFVGLLCISLYPLVFNYNNAIKYIVPAICGISFLYIRKSHQIQWFGLLILVIMLVQIAGSNTGIFLKIGLLFLLILPGALLQLSTHKEIGIGLTAGIYTLVFSGLLYLVFIYGIGQSPSIRLQATTPIDVPGYEMIHTTQDQAFKIQSVVHDLQHVKAHHTSLLIYGHQPMLYHLTDLAPATKEYWFVGNNLTGMQQVFSQISYQKKLPILLDTKEAIFSAADEQAKALFLRQHHYKLVKSTVNYDIWIPNEL